jgi:hypothetical protein
MSSKRKLIDSQSVKARARKFRLDRVKKLLEQFKK